MKTNSNINAPGTSIPGRDGNLLSLWQAGAEPKPLTSKPYADDIYDALIIGGGITGLTAALMMQKAGKKCVLADAHTIGYGTTGGTSAHINTFADTTYKEAESNFGEKGAQLFADAINEAIGIIKSNIALYGINCDYEEKTGYIYAETSDEVKQLADFYDGTVKVGVDISYTDTVPCTMPFQKAVKLEGQAQFHPLKYLKCLQDAFEIAGGLILENTLVDGLKNEDGVYTAKAGDMTIKAGKVIYATHIPPGINVFSLRCAPYRSYVVGVTLISDNYPDALIYDMQEPYHYIRTHEINGQKYLIVGGNDHKTGHDDPEKAFEDLENFVSKYYDVATVDYKWSSQYYVPVDGFPYIGHFTGEGEGVYCATGYNGNGMMLGTIAGKILSDLATGVESKYTEIFNPSRLKPVSAFTTFIEENADVAYHFVADRLGVHEVDSLQSLPPDSGKVVEFDGKKVAAYKDTEGIIYALNPVCTHAMCIVDWNQEEKSWDCPCHGARYDIHGTVITGPATIDLQKLHV